MKCLLDYCVHSSYHKSTYVNARKLIKTLCMGCYVHIGIIVTCITVLVEKILNYRGFVAPPCMSYCLLHFSLCHACGF